ncbi:Uncharacterised protein [Legionella cincinnatiensis]|uniref:Uncharacterized protein n=1 Tax=Legionella cincinnatiensis TaxID=28085 RepID=A0A378INP3_9GAMM|nr:Uncharacterised protein [Legionella cincinnatiensis]
MIFGDHILNDYLKKQVPVTRTVKKHHSKDELLHETSLSF